VISQVAEKIAVMYAGKIVESSTVEQIFIRPLHPYTRGLIDSIPARCVDSGKEKQKHLQTIPGSVPSLYNLAPGCRFCERCSYADSHCAQKEPSLKEIEQGHFVSCWKSSDIPKEEKIN
jgi:oligopeptide/dipeptide ABC transporter ATP-binding protein